ncbi:MAG: bifunctional (p)ppGpp synthetase/guanosine-3',5'-bis(diphosphate) 3'-pyrophosphohydrolase [Chloroflexi bacterium]|nr:MAG: GTP pyrophosphokinase [Chloroflexi bacterium OLB13]MBC6954677.1 bifunctional (p)ppGpp synthetase/guanosine-3',5'-bis(diphosphate) 3'-pyrophosphohydrolase [Chloroflexota bacterium]MBW7879552.1 bifunctional (p)ppGpp synthetase/guanosine-3',5'-bis(diphosphate) 3'-pyrophosphohydrolase [Anaerolineae bacterium]MDL1916095.1 bifunctional (p)ppGpp synthetase/guanosine-3',5'-bis(diphosphate) 3'-pyrophosphohydrolase [Anaerolineae bacterium CFX4]OQY81077.1 MAG: (p)ppGpp synthetase [Anaerolineae bac
MVSTVYTAPSLEDLVAPLPALSPNDRAIIERAYRKAEAAHAGQFRKSGEPYFTHCAAVAAILTDLHLDAEAIAAALLHDTLEDTDITYQELVDEFGLNVANLVDAVTKLKVIPINIEKEVGRRTSTVNKELEYIRKMFMKMGQDIRVVLIKLADRLHNMRTLHHMAEDRQRGIARETMDIFAPLANRLGIWQIKWELEDLSLRYLEPDVYRTIANKIDERRADRERYMDEIVSALKDAISREGLENVTVSGRPKHITSIYNKMQRKNLPFEQIYDVRAIRVIVDSVAQCYQVLGIVHNLWQPIPREFDDYIARPKDNMYQSLHTAVYVNGKTVEVQIRTWEMHQHAEYGIAAHWRYKEGGKANDPEFERRLNILRKMMEFGDEVNQNAEQFVDAMKTEFFQDRVYVVTPKGDIIDLPAGATPVDFAYHIHTDIGHRTRGAKVNGRLVNLNYQLQSGQQVEIMTAKRGGPSMDWLNPDTGYVVTNRAREKIRYYFKKLNREQHIQLGRETVDRELRKIGLADAISHHALAELFGIESTEDFLAAVGAGDINAAQITNRAMEEDRRRTRAQQAESELLKPKRNLAPLVVDPSHGVQVKGTSNMLNRLATCCNPVPGDEIVGYVTRGRGVTIHRQDCPNIANISDRERLIEVAWGGSTDDQRFIVPIDVVAYDRDGLLRDISTVIADERINIHGVNVDIRGDVAILHLKLQISSPRQLTRIISRISMTPSVTDVYRPNAG